MDERVARFLLAIEGGVVVHTDAGPQKSTGRLEAELVFRGDHPVSRGIEVARFGVAVASVDAEREPTGVITVIGRRGRGALETGDESSDVRVDLECDLNYESLDRATGVTTEATCYYIPAFEPAGATIEGRLFLKRRSALLTNVRVRVACAAGELEQVHLIEIDAGEIELPRIAGFDPTYRLGEAGEWAPSQDSNTDANICISVNRRRLICQPVGFRDSAGDANPSGNTSAAQFATAQTVWGKGCIQIEVRPTHLITNATLKTSSDVAAIRNSYTDADANVIEVFFVANSLAAQGGGTAGGIGVASCKPVIAEPNGGNPVLLAHELGHVINLLHPGAGANSDAGTVMAPTGSAMNPGTQTVTHFMCTNIANPVLQTEMVACCLTHDIGNHYLRDFPSDPGNEPSEPVPTGMNRYAMSNVWNRRTNTPGTPSASTGPEHQQPVRFNADMTPRTNWLFARVEQLVNLKVRNAVVKFYLKNPGSGGGASNLTLLGQVPVPDALAVGAPQNVSLMWTVPAATPQHSCVFAVVRSDAEQEGDVNALDWWQFEALSRQDNDWAQRNLDIEAMSSGNDDSNLVEGAPWMVFLPPEEVGGKTLVYDLDATRADGLEELTAEVLGYTTEGVPPGGEARIEVPVDAVRSPALLVLSARVPAGLEPGREFVVDVTPSIDGRPLIGFSSVFRAGRTREAVWQTVDVVAAGFDDLSSVVDLPGADEIVCGVRPRAGCPPLSAERLAKDVSELAGAFERLRGIGDRVPEAGETGVADAAERLLDALASGDPLAVLYAYRALGARAAAAANLIATRASLS